MAHFSTSIQRIDFPQAKSYGKFHIVGSVPASCCNEHRNSRVFETEREAMNAILADPWIRSTPEQLIQYADCTCIRIFPADSPRQGEWVMSYRNSSMPAPAFTYFNSREDAEESALARCK